MTLFGFQWSIKFTISLWTIVRRVTLELYTILYHANSNHFNANLHMLLNVEQQ